jgi:hypothetical protein
VIRFTWIQARTQTMTALGALAALAIVLAITGPHLAHLYDTSIAACAAHGDCPAVRAAFLHNDSTFRTALGVVVIVVPALTGIFWGAPLVARELEAGTFRLIWSQSVTRTSWLAAKLGVVGLASMAVAGLTSLAVTWWASPLDRVRMDPYGTFDQRGIVPIGYAAFGFALGVTAGILIRRTVPAMATALVLFVSARLAFTHWLRPHLIAPAHHDLTITTASVLGYGPNSLGGASTLQLGPPDIPGAWIYSTQLIDRTGLPITSGFLRAACPALVKGQSGAGAAGQNGPPTAAPPAAQKALQDCAAKAAARYHEVVNYQPASRYWAFQWYELAIFLAAALALAGACFWRVRRHRGEELHIRRQQPRRDHARAAA